MAYGVVYRLDYCNREGDNLRLDIEVDGYSGDIHSVSSTGNPFRKIMLNNALFPKLETIRPTEARMEIYQDENFDIDNLLTSDEIEIRVTHYINSVLDWRGFVLPEFFQETIEGDPVISLTALDRLGTLKNIPFPKIYETLSFLDVIRICLSYTGLNLDIKTVLGFQSTSDTFPNRPLANAISSERLFNERGDSINCYDVLRSICDTFGAYITQSNGYWWIVNKEQLEIGGGKVTEYSRNLDDGQAVVSEVPFERQTIDFDFINTGGERLVRPILAEVGILGELGGSPTYPLNNNFRNYSSGNFSNWLKFNGFVAGNYVDNARRYNSDGTINTSASTPGFTNKLLNRNSRIVPATSDLNSLPYLESSPIEIRADYVLDNKVNINYSFNVTTKNKSGLVFGIVLETPNVENKYYVLNGSTGTWVKGGNNKNSLYKTPGLNASFFLLLAGGLPFIYSPASSDELDDLDAIEVNVTGSATIGADIAAIFSQCKLYIRVFGSILSGGNGMVSSIVNSVELAFNSGVEKPKGNLYKSIRGGNYTARTEFPNAVYSDYITTGLNGYFYSYPSDDTSIIYPIGSTSWRSSGDAEYLPLLQHITRQMSKIYGETQNELHISLDATHIDHINLFRNVCNDEEYVISRYEVDYLSSTVSLILSQIKRPATLGVEYIYSYFGNEDGVRTSNLGTVSGGGGYNGGFGGNQDLQSVTEVGNTTTLDITVGGLNIGDDNISVDGEYLYINEEKAKVGHSDTSDYATNAGHALTADHATHANTADYAYDADKWDGYQFGAFLDQPVRTVDSPTFQAVTANELNALQSLMIPQVANAASQALWKSGGYLMLGTNKTWSGNSDLWNGLAQPDYVTQPVRPADSPKFTGVSSPSFASGFSGHGFRMVQDGNGDYVLELDRLSVRKDFTVHELIVNKIRATNGALWVSDAAKITNAYASGGGYICAIDTDGGTITVPFVIGDIVRCQVFNGTSIKYYTAQVTSVGAGDFAISIIEGAGIPAIGDEIVRIGNVSNANRQGALYLTSSDSGSPYLDVVDGVNSASLAGKTKARLGKLDGIVDPDFGALSGYGLYAQNGFFKGVVRVANGSNVYTMDQTDEAIDNLQVGVRNYQINSAVKSTSGFNAINNITSAEIENGNELRVIGGNNGYIYFPSLSIGIPSDEVVTVSFMVRNNASSINNLSVSANGNGVAYPFLDLEPNQGWTRFNRTFLIQDHTISSTLGVLLLENYNEGYFDISIKEIMVTVGNKVVDWVPAPEDTSTEINTLRTETYTEFSILEGQIASKVAQTTFETFKIDNTNEIDNAVLLAQSAQSDATSAKNYIDNILPNELSAIHDALDGLMEQHFRDYDPTVSNDPADSWTTTALKEEHLGDLFYNTSNGKSWRWVKEGSTYFWMEIVNSDLQAALQAAAEAQATANSKRRVFTSTPFTPYDVGDLWVQGSGGDIMRCVTAKTAAQSYVAADWQKASKYTDDTAANAANAAVGALATRVTTAETSITQNANEISLRATKTEVTTQVAAVAANAATDATNKANAAQTNANNYTDGQVSTINTRVASAETAIQQNAEAILLRATKTELEQTKKDITSQVYDGIFAKGLEFWTSDGSFAPVNSNPAIGNIVAGLGVNGGNVWRVSGEAWIYSYNPIAVEFGHRYRVSLRCRMVTPYTNHSITYCGFAQYRADGSTPTNLGLNYFVRAGANLEHEGGEWQTFVGEIVMDGVNNVYADIAYFKVAIGFNYGGGDAVIDCDSIIVEDITQFDESRVYTNSQVSILQGQISLKADQTEVSSLLTRVTSAEIEIDGLQGEIILKASQAEVNGLTSRISSAELEIDGLQGEITLKATQAEVNAIDGRLSAAEVKITPEAINLTVSSQITDKVNAIEVGGRNRYSNKFTVLDPYLVALGDKDTEDAPNGFAVTGEASVTGYVRVLNVIDSNGEWTVSGWVRGSQDVVIGVTIDICDLGGKRFYTNDQNTWVYFSHTVNVTNHGDNPSIYNFVDFGELNWAYFFFKDIKIEKGNKATDWTPAPEDVKADIDLRPTEAEIKSSFIMTSNSISLLGQSIDMTGKVTFNSLDGAAQGSINTANANASAALGNAAIAQSAADNAQGTANTALSNANNANSNLSALQLSLGAMAYENVVGVAKLDSTVIDGGYIRTALLDVESIFAEDITATGLITAKNLTVTENSKIGGFKVSKSIGDLADEYNRLENSNAKTSLIFNNLNDASTYLRVNAGPYDPILNIGTKEPDRVGVRIQTFATGVTGLYILNNISGGTGKAIASYGSHEFYTRPGETWNSPGVLAIMHTDGGTSPLNVRWKIGSLTFSLAQIVGGYRVSHNIGHTEYFVQPHINNINIAIGISAITSSYFEVGISGGTGIGYQHIFTVIGRNVI